MVVRIGTSGWSYDHWQPELYPPGLPAAARLARYAAAFATAELNSSFYRWPRPAAFRGWRHKLPDGFRLSVKAPRGLTHGRRLYAPETWTRSASRRAGTSWAISEPCCWPSSRPRTRAMTPGWPISCSRSPAGSGSAPSSAIPAGIASEVFALLEAHGAAYCVMSGANLPCILRATTDFAYVRMHGPDHHHLYAGSYSDTDLTWWAGRIREWDAAGKDVFVYFNNDGNANAVRNARTLRALLDQ